MPIRPPAYILAPLLLERDRLQYALAEAIRMSFRAADVGCARPAGEVDRLVYFFAEGLPVIEAQFNLILQPHRVRATLSGIFCHQTPRVVPDGPPPGIGTACELGDMLFLATYGQPMYGRILGNAILVQAKQDTSTVQGTLQDFLYSNADAFTYQNPRGLAGQTRDLTESQYHLWFWGFEEEPYRFWPPGSGTYGACARRYMRRFPSYSFETTLADLICGITGRRWHLLPQESPETGWSKIINDLVRVTANSALRRQNAYIVRDRETLRGEDAIRAVNQALGQPAPFLIRASLRRFLRLLDPELEQLGAELEGQSAQFLEDDFKKRHHKRFVPDPKDSGGAPPHLGNERPPAENEDGGCSFVVMDFSRA